jgi:uncharacterized membrane protein (UPF0127 family)
MPKPAAARTVSVRKSAFSTYIVPAIILIVIAAAVVTALLVDDSNSPAKKEPRSTAVQTACGPYRHDGNVVIKNQVIYVEQANNSTEFETGLAGRPCIPANQGMFFAFNKDGRYPFWMKGMKFPIDIVWITSGHSVAAIEVDESPSTYPDKFVNKIPAQYVLELKANRTNELGLKIGSTIKF